eukprot:5810005-Amphidinium_carterae.1
MPTALCIETYCRGVLSVPTTLFVGMILSEVLMNKSDVVGFPQHALPAKLRDVTAYCDTMPKEAIAKLITK